jgi:hypothetical protein
MTMNIEQIIFCADPLHSKLPDPIYKEEYDVALEIGFTCSLISYESLVDMNDTEQAVARIPMYKNPSLAIYRGWMIRPEIYDCFYESLSHRNVTLINSPVQYRTGHLLPEAYPYLEGNTPRSIWYPLAPNDEPDTGTIIELLALFDSKPIIIKDYVKSRKHEWYDACYIPSANDYENVTRVVKTFIVRQGNDLVGGLVFREFVDMEPAFLHPRSGMPIAREYRRFYVDGQPIVTVPYWEIHNDNDVAEIPVDLFSNIAETIPSRFFTLDFARLQDGSWIIIEIGDGQVSGLPENLSPEIFYQAIKSKSK